MTWQYVTLIVAVMAAFCWLSYLGHKKQLAESGLKAMDDNNLLLKMFMDAQSRRAAE